MQSQAAILPVESLKRLAAAMCAFTLLLTGVSSTPASADAADRFVSVIVQGVSPMAVDSAIEAVGGTVTQPLPIIQGVSADVPASSEATLRSMPGVLNVSENAPVGFQGTYDAVKTAHQITSVTGSSALWDQGVNGAGTTVALIDTGVYNHPDLAGRVTCGIDLSHEAGTEANCADTFGHGTFMAGLIAGNGSSSGGKWKGSAPGANIVSVKAAGFDGATDVTHILAAIQWVVMHKDAYGIDVLSLSLGTDTSMDYRLNPLNFAVERAWQAGITVVVSAGNRGPGPSTITSPADDPFVITVGASSHQGNVGVGDDTVPVYSGRGPTASNGLAKPDVVSPGTHTVSLRSPGSAIDQAYPTSVVDGSYFKGTGTSMANASVAGQVAQMLQANPGLTPNQVKFRLMSTARPISTTDPMQAGRGQTDVLAAATTSAQGEANQGVELSSGIGPLSLARGTLGAWATTPLGSAKLVGEFSAQTDPTEVSLTNPLGLITFNSTAYVSGTNWNGTNWNATNWNTSGWAATNWNGTNWNGTNWNGTNWNGTNWNGTNWNGTNWNGTNWNGTNWNATNWNNTDWDGTNWNATNWNAAWYAAAWD